jgi:outer membrane protein
VKKLIFFVALMIVTACAGRAQNLKIAFVNSDKILQELPEYIQVKTELESTVKTWQDELEKMSKEFQDALEDYQKKEAMLSADAKVEKQKQLQDLQQKARDFQYQKFDQRDGETAKLREKKFGPIQEKVMKAIAKVAKENKYNYVFDKLDAATNILYADSKFDLTYKVIDELKTK